MTATKNVEEKSWTPEIIWELLRRNKNYKSAVERFNEAATKEKESYLGHTHSLLQLAVELQLEHSQMVKESGPNEIIALPSPTLSGCLKNLEDALSWGDLSEAERQFQREYGSFIRAPLHYNYKATELPEGFLEQVICGNISIRSFDSSYENLDIRLTSKSNVVYFVVEANLHFPDSVIKARIDDAICKKLDEMRALGHASLQFPKTRREDKELGVILELWDEVESLAPENRKGHWASLTKKYLPKVHGEDAKMSNHSDWSQKAYENASQLISQFDLAKYIQRTKKTN